MQIICSTGLSSDDRKSLQEAVRALTSCIYEGDLTDRTTHLVAKRSAADTEKVRVARELGLPIVCKSWIFDSAAAGGTLLDLTPNYRIYQPPPPLLDENASASTANSTLTTTASTQQVCSFVRAPLPLLREAAERGELSFEPIPTDADTIKLGGKLYALDAPTGFLRQQAVVAAVAGGRRASSSPGGTSSGPTSGDSRAYTLRELLHGLRLSSKSHADYFLECVTRHVEPVLLLDKKLLLASVLPAAGAELRGADEAGRARATLGDTPLSAALSSAAGFIAAPLSAATLSAIGTPQWLREAAVSLEAPSSAAPSSSALSSAPTLRASDPRASSGRASASPLACEEKAELLRQLSEAADERAKLNAQVSSLSATLREERECAEAAVLLYGASRGRRNQIVPRYLGNET